MKALKMAKLIITIKAMPESQDSNLEELSKKIKDEITSYGGNVTQEETEPVAFGLKAIKITFALDESKGMEELEKKFKEIKEASSIEVINVGRALG